MTALIGFRRWRIDEDGTLRALTAPYTSWSAPASTASCRLEPAGRVAAHDPDLAPHPDCSCGLYALHEPEPRRHRVRAAVEIAGVVQLWGTVDVHGRGVRAQHARPVLLGLPAGGDRDGRLRRAADRYGARLLDERMLVLAAGEWGTVIAPEQRPTTLTALCADALAALRRRRRGYIPDGPPRITELMACRLGGLAASARADERLVQSEHALHRLLWLILTAAGAIDSGDEQQRRHITARDAVGVAEQLTATITLAEIGADDPATTTAPMQPGPPILDEEFAALVRHAACVSDDRLVEELWAMRHTLGLTSDAGLARDLVDAGVTVWPVADAALRQPGQPKRLSDPWRRDTAKRLLATVTDPRQIATCIEAAGGVADPGTVTDALARGDFMLSDTGLTLLKAAGDQAGDVARRVIADPRTSPQTRVLCLRYLDDRDGARRLATAQRELLLDLHDLVDLAGAEHCAAIARAWLTEPGTPDLKRLQITSSLLGSDDVAEEITRQLDSGRLNPACWHGLELRLLHGLNDLPADIRSRLLDRTDLPATVAVSLLRSDPQPRPALATRLWESAELRADEALVVLEGMWPDGPDSARACLRAHQRQPMTRREAGRFSASMLFLGQADRDAVTEAGFRAADTDSPLAVRIAALATLGRGAYPHAARILAHEQPLAEELRDACRRVTDHGVLWRPSDWRLFKGLAAAGL